MEPISLLLLLSLLPLHLQHSFLPLLPLQQRLPTGCQLRATTEENLSTANLLDRAHVAPRGARDGLLPGRMLPLDTSETGEGEAARREAGWRLRKIDGHITGYFRPPPRPKSVPSTWASCAGPEAIAAEGESTR